MHTSMSRCALGSHTPAVAMGVSRGNGPPLLATIHEGKQPVCQARMKDIIFAADPEEVVQRSVFQARQWPDGFSQEERNFLASFKHLFKESTPTRHVVVVRVFVGLRA